MQMTCGRHQRLSTTVKLNAKMQLHSQAPSHRYKSVTHSPITRDKNNIEFTAVSFLLPVLFLRMMQGSDSCSIFLLLITLYQCHVSRTMNSAHFIPGKCKRNIFAEKTYSLFPNLYESLHYANFICFLPI